MFHRRACQLTAVLSTTIYLSACGYTFQGSTTSLPPNVRTIYIAPIENKTTESKITVALQEAIREQFERYGVVQTTDQQIGSDATLEVSVLEMKRNTRTANSNDTALSYDTSLEISGSLKRSNGSILWKDDSFDVSSSYASSSSTLVTSSAEFNEGLLGVQDAKGLSTRSLARNQEQAAVETLTTNVAKKIYDDAIAPEF